jgi:excisionase family DNA binding protein
MTDQPADSLAELRAIGDRLEQRLTAVERRLEAGTVREAYTTEQAAERLGLSAWSVRQACNTGRVRGEKTANGRGWRIPHDELLRVELEGLPRVGD